MLQLILVSVLGRTDPIDKFYSFGKQLGKGTVDPPIPQLCMLSDEGAFSIVYLATEYASGKEYAVKAITKKPQDRNAMSMVVTEIQVFRALGNHNHVVRTTKHSQCLSQKESERRKGIRTEAEANTICNPREGFN